MPYRRLWLTSVLLCILLVGIPSLTKDSKLASSIIQKLRSIVSPNAVMPRTPVYFLSHGGPTLIEDTHHPAYKTIQDLGHEITHSVKPKAVLIISAHWQSPYPNTVEVSSPTTHSLLYDYYGFPSHFYNLSYPATGSPKLADKVIALLSDAGIKAQGADRGLDHGVFVPFMVAFDPKTNPLNVPIIQLSLYDSDDGAAHYALGAALSQLRDEGVVIVGGGMSVHNLRDFRRAMMGGFDAGGRTKPQPYAESFDEALKVAVEQPVEKREEAMVELLKRKDARQAHPSFEHLLPVHVAAGAAGEDRGKRLWTLCEGSLGWGMVRFGEVTG